MNSATGLFHYQWYHNTRDLCNIIHSHLFEFFRKGNDSSLYKYHGLFIRKTYNDTSHKYRWQVNPSVGTDKFSWGVKQYCGAAGGGRSVSAGKWLKDNLTWLELPGVQTFSPDRWASMVKKLIGHPDVTPAPTSLMEQPGQTDSVWETHLQDMHESLT